MAQKDDVNYPDLLGGMTRGQRAVMDFIHCALATRPFKIAAGQTFEVIFLIQNTTDADIDVTLELKLPETDKANKKGMFFSKTSRLLLGLQPAEVGYVILPASCSPKTQPDNYVIGLNIKTELLHKNAKIKVIRKPEGGGKYDIRTLPENTRGQMMLLSATRWNFQAKRHQIAAMFEITPPGISAFGEFKTGWTSLWTMRDHLDEYLLEGRIREHYLHLKRGFTLERLYQPLKDSTLKHFAEAGYPLKPVEALFIAKALTYQICKITPKSPNDIEPHPNWPEWYKHLVRVLFQEERLREYPVKLATEVLYTSLLKDAILFTFDALHKYMDEDFGTPDELNDYAVTVVQAVEQKQALDFGKVYLPLIAGGIFLNREITESGESARDTLLALETAAKTREPEKNEDNSFVFDLLAQGIEKTLEDFRWIP